MFCDLRDKYIFYEENGVVMTVALFAYIDGNLMIIPRRHVRSAKELTPGEWETMRKMMYIAKKLIRKVHGMKGVQYILRDGGPEAGGRVRPVRVPAVAVNELVELDAALAEPAIGPVALRVGSSVAPWVEVAVGRVRSASRVLCVEVGDPGDIGDARAGREIGLVTALIEVGVQPSEIVGVDPERVRRVAAIVARWHGGGADA